MVVSMKGEEGRQQKEEPGQEVMTQTADDDDVLGTAVPRAAQAELAGLRAEVEQLREQIKEAAARREREIEGGERAHAAAMSAHGQSALHARLLWSEAHQLEESLADAASTHPSTVAE